MYHDILDGVIPCCETVDERHIRLVDHYHVDPQGTDWDQTIVDAINQSIAELKRINPNIIGYNAARLVEISHLWRCWIVAMSIAKLLGKSSYKMSSLSIRNSNQFFGYE